jgi:hypothetical protein
MRLSRNRSTKILKDIFTKGYELVLYWNQDWPSTDFIDMCQRYMGADEDAAIELEKICARQGYVVLTRGSVFEMDVYTQLWSRGNFQVETRVQNSWV